MPQNCGFPIPINLPKAIPYPSSSLMSPQSPNSPRPPPVMLGWDFGYDNSFCNNCGFYAAISQYCVEIGSGTICNGCARNENRIQSLSTRPSIPFVGFQRMCLECFGAPRPMMNFIPTVRNASAKMVPIMPVPPLIATLQTQLITSFTFPV